MAKTNKKNVAEESLNFKAMFERFPEVKVKLTCNNQRTFISDVKLPKEYTLRRKVVSMGGEITLISFSKGSKTFTFCRELTS